MQGRTLTNLNITPARNQAVTLAIIPPLPYQTLSFPYPTLWVTLGFCWGVAGALHAQL